MELRILGPLEADRDGRPLDLGGLKQRALLALLLLEANRVVPRDGLIDALWEEDPPATAHKALQVYVSRLRALLGAERLETRAPGYALRVEPEEVDVARFQRLREEGRPDHALALWRGPPLAEFAGYRFAQPEIARLEELRIGCLEERAERELAAGRHAELAAGLEALVKQNPLRERLRGQLMLCLYRCGRQAAALEAYRDARSALVDELGIEPGHTLRELHQAILEQDPILEPVPTTAPPAEPEPPARRGGGMFVGRARELAELTSALDDAFAGRGRLCLLIGEPGIGKSQLAEELMADAEAGGARVLAGRCWEAGGAPAYWPWVQSLRAYVRACDADELRVQLGSGAADLAQLVPELSRRLPDIGEPAAAEPDEARFRLFDAMAQFLRRAAAERPLVLALDDLHAADAPSLLLLRFIARELGSMRVLVLGACRDVDPLPVPALADMLADVGRDPVTRRLELSGLSATEVADYVARVAREIASPELAAELHEQTEGNPLFVGEIVRLLSVEGRRAIPESVREVIARRLTHLSEACYGVLLWASVIGREFALDALERVSGVAEDDLIDLLDEAIASRVVSDVPGHARFAQVQIRDRLYDGLGGARHAAAVEPAGLVEALEPLLWEGLLAPPAAGGYRFAHAVMRQVLYDDQPAARRAQRHARFVDVLAARLEREPDRPVAEVAHHAVMAARGGLDPAPALQWSRAAAREARAVLAHAEAAGHLERALEALELGELGSAPDRLALLLEAASTHAEAAVFDASQERYAQAAVLARRLGDASAFAEAALGYAEFQHYGVVDEEALALLEEARGLLPAGDSVLRARVLGRLAVRLDPATGQARREALLDEAISMARELGDRTALARLLALSPLVNWRPERSARRGADAAEVLAGGDREAALWARIVLHCDRFAEGDIAGADRELAAYDRLAGELRQRYYRWNGRVLAATRAIFDGRLEPGRALAAEAVAVNREHEQDSEQEWVVQQLLLARITGRPGDVPLDELRAFADRYPGLPVWRALLAVGEWVAADADAARAAYDECAPRGPAALPVDADLPCTLALLADVSVSVGALAHTGELRERLEPHAARNVLTDRSWAAWGAAARPLGRLAAALGDTEAAAAHFEHAVALHRRWGSRPWLAIAIRDYAASLPGVPPAELVEEGEALARRLGLRTPTSTKLAQ